MGRQGGRRDHSPPSFFVPTPLSTQSGREKQTSFASSSPLAVGTPCNSNTLRRNLDISQVAAKKAKSRGAWEGSIVGEGHIEFLHHRRMLPPAERVAVLIPMGEGSPVPQAAEAVVFAKRFAHGFRMPASDFFSRFLAQFGQQPHHLAANAILQLAAFVTLSKGFLGIELCLDLWR
ncbi:hypothetical protein D1007_02503 [Hordeum vulgare]|nr:hypothetical protein D1007_02503 [Hordeum vulgare]